MVNTPHDAIFKTFMSHTETVRDFLGIHLPANLLAICDLQTLQLESGSFVDEELRSSYSDILWSLQTRKGRGYVYALIEHQSSPDKHMAFRLMRYAFAAMQRHLNAGNEQLLLVIPILFYHGEKSPYPFSMKWLDEFAEPEVARVLYDGALPLVDLTVLSDDEIMSHRRVALLEFLQKNIRRRDLLEMMENLIAILRTGNTTEGQFIALLNYLKKAGWTHHPEAVFRQWEGLRPHYEDTSMTKMTLWEWYQKEHQHDFDDILEARLTEGRNKALTEGHSEGEKQATLKIAQALLRNGIAMNTVAQSTGLSVEQLNE
ncbi:MAG: Rpn family recombination-promoting nuclease/putative transposase, partial [Hafnia alvei]